MGGVWPTEASALDDEQRRLAALAPPPWPFASDCVAVAGCFLAFARGQQGPGHPGDRGWAAAALLQCGSGRCLATSVVPSAAGASYEPGRLALREGPALAAAVAALETRPEVLLVDATGRDHPRGAGLALHLGAVLDLPTIGVTHRPLLAVGELPEAARGATSPLRLHGQVVGAWLRTQPGVRPLAVHAGWRVAVDDAVRLVLACSGTARTPEPLRQARVAARTARSFAEGRAHTTAR